ncbi:MAG TPA: hypothetical protein VGE39_09490 [Prosthecobacter sp.]
MKVLATLALVITGLTLSSCACKDGKCMFGKKKAAACDSCTAGTVKTKGGSCCSH